MSDATRHDPKIPSADKAPRTGADPGDPQPGRHAGDPQSTTSVAKTLQTADPGSLSEGSARRSEQDPAPEALPAGETHWCRALTLQERASTLDPPPRAQTASESGAAASISPGARPRTPSIQYASELQRLRRSRWLGQEPFDSGDWLERRLAADGLGRRDLERLLLEPEPDLLSRQGSTPGWVRSINAAYSRSSSCLGPGRGPDMPEVAPELSGPDGAGPATGFLELIRPLTEVARGRIAAHLDRLRTEAGDLLSAGDQLLDQLWHGISGRLLTMISRTLVLELNVARLESRLEGDSPDSRFTSFVGQLGEPETAIAIIREYPVLARQVQTALDHWVEASCELLDHLLADAPEISSTFAKGEPLGALVGVRPGGDLHRRGRSVVMLELSTGLRIVYKPRSLAVDRDFQNLLAWLAELAPEQSLRRLAILDRGDHGWMEHVEATPCADVAGVRRFYLRLGSLLALLWVLEATDCHYENLIASGDQPVLVDLESLLHPRFPLLRALRAAGGSGPCPGRPGPGRAAGGAQGAQRQEPGAGPAARARPSGTGGLAPAASGGRPRAK